MPPSPRGFGIETTHQDTVEGAGLATALGVTEGRHPGVETESVDEDFLDVIGLDRLEIPVKCAFCDNNDRLALPNQAMLIKASARRRPAPEGWRKRRHSPT